MFGENEEVKTALRYAGILEDLRAVDGIDEIAALQN